MTGRRKLLLADDSPAIRKVISLTFADEGVEVVTAADGREALGLLGDERAPDIVLADAVMPGPDGYELCERVKRDERLRHVPVVLLVGAFEPFNEAEARRVGADTVLTKPFQSIRDLVNKVGSLLGGEAKPESDERGPGAQAQPGHRELAEEVQTRREAATAAPPGRAASFPAADPAPGRAEAAGEEPAASFADLGADDELIEATPADSFAGASAAPRADEDSFLDLDEPDADAYRPREAGGVSASEAPMTTDDYLAQPLREDAGRARAFGDERREAAQASFSPAGANSPAPPAEAARPAEVARPAFAAQAAGAAAADDALLDLGQVEPPASPAAEADEFILDLDDDFDARPAGSARAAAGPANPLSFGDLDDAPADAAGAFAEAAHGDTVRPRGDSFELLEDPPQPFGASSSGPASAASSESEAARMPFEFSALPAETRDPVVAREVVAQDAPPSPAARARDFIEPEVVPAEEPVPGTVESAFTDGSVEGDRPKPPGFLPDAPAPPRPFVPAQPSTAGLPVGEARAGADESARAAELSPETIDAIARRVVELMSEKVVREIAWEVVPDLAELLIKRRLDEERNR